MPSLYLWWWYVKKKYICTKNNAKISRKPTANIFWCVLRRGRETCMMRFTQGARKSHITICFDQFWQSDPGGPKSHSIYVLMCFDRVTQGVRNPTVYMFWYVLTEWPREHEIPQYNMFWCVLTKWPRKSHSKYVLLCFNPGDVKSHSKYVLCWNKKWLLIAIMSTTTGCIKYKTEMYQTVMSILQIKEVFQVQF